MKLVLSNYHYRAEHAGGGPLHIEAFIRQAVAEGHRLYSTPACKHPAVRPIRPDLPGQWFHLRDADLHYVRVQDAYPRAKISRWFTPPLRRLAPRPRLVWEFNTIPEQGVCEGRSTEEIRVHKKAFARAAPQCDLAICVSEAIADYVRSELGVRTTFVVPNGGDPLPESPSASGPGFNVLWAGSAYIRWHAFDLLLDAARLLAARPGPRPVRFHFYGVGTESLADPPPNVVLHGPVGHAEIASASATMHAALCLYEPGPGDYSSPLKFYDGLAAGLPVVTSPQPQMDAVQRELGSAELIVFDRRPETLARILRELADDEPRRLRHAASARLAIRDRYNWPTLMRKLFARLSALASSPDPHPAT